MDQTRLSPLSDQDIISRLELFLQNKNSDVFTSWILAILQYTPSKVPTDFDFNENRDTVKNWIHDQLLENEDARELSRIQKIFLRNLAEGLAEPLHYLNGTGQFLALTYPEDSTATELPELLSQINEALFSMGLASFGQDGEMVAYDPALHELADGMCSKGDPVVILQCGWKIKGDVYKKAIVQKGE